MSFAFCLSRGCLWFSCDALLIVLLREDPFFSKLQMSQLTVTSDKLLLEASNVCALMQYESILFGSEGGHLEFSDEQVYTRKCTKCINVQSI
jgi:hypothetical protein